MVKIPSGNSTAAVNAIKRTQQALDSTLPAAQRVVDSFGEYNEAVQALESYIVGLIAGPCPCADKTNPISSNQTALWRQITLSQTAAVCNATIGPGVNIREFPTVDSTPIFVTTESVEVSVFARTTYDQTVKNHWYQIVYQGQSGWTARIDVSDECNNQLAASEIDLAVALASGTGSTGPGTIDPGSIPLGTLKYAVCEGTVSGNLRSGPSTSINGVDLGDVGIPAHFFAKTHTEGELEAGSNNQRVWYFVKINPFNLPDYPSPQYGWSASDVTSPPCAAQLPEVPSDFNPTVGIASIDCSAIPPTGCVEIRDVATLFGGSKVRTHPSAPTGQQDIYGREVGRLQGRTRFRFTAVQPDVDGCWFRISAPDSGREFWVKDSSDGIQYVSIVSEGECNNASYFSENDVQLGAPSELQKQPCTKLGTHLYPTGAGEVERIAFIIQCETGGDSDSAVNVASVIVNRMEVTGKPAIEIIESGAWTCICGSDQSVEPNGFVLDLANQLHTMGTNPVPLNNSQGNTTVPEIGRALYTVGIGPDERFNPNELNDPAKRDAQIDLILSAVYLCYASGDPACVPLGCTSLHPLETAKINLKRIFLGADGLGLYITAYFSNWPVAAICASLELG